MSLACFALLSTKGCSLSAIELFRLNGEFYTPTPGTETKSWNILVDSGAMFEQITVELDITPGDWWDKNPDGLHNLFWLTRGDTWRHNTIGYVNLFGEGRLELKQLTNLDLPKAITRAAMTPYYGTTGKTFHLRYTFDCRSGKVSSEISEEGQVQASLTMDATTGRIIIPDGYLRIWIGLEGHYNECPTYGWTYANLRIQAKPAKPALFVHKQNPRYFDDGSGKAIALCGVNNGWELQDNGWSTPFVLDWEKYLDYLKSYHHNYIRLWRVESTIGREPTDVLTTPMPYLRTGPGTAHDGEPKFDLDRFNPDYFDRMRERCLDARERGIFVCVMLFEKHSTFFQRSEGGRGLPWMAHPFHPENNINGLNPDINGDESPVEIHHLPEEQSDPKRRDQAQQVLDYQEAYIRKVVDTLNDLENVIFEVCNEALPDDATDRWQAHLARYLKEYEKKKPLQHLVGFTGPGKYNIDDPWPDMEEQKIDAVDFVSPREVDLYRNNPPVNNGEKIVFADSDHIYPYGRDNIWVWKCFLRGLHPQALELFGTAPEDKPRIDYDRDRLVRIALGNCVRYCEKMNLAAMRPLPELSSTAYCLADPGKEYLVFAPDGKSFTIQLEGPADAYQIEWHDIESGQTSEPANLKSPQLTLPSEKPFVAYILHKSRG